MSDLCVISGKTGINYLAFRFSELRRAYYEKGIGLRRNCLEFCGGLWEWLSPHRTWLYSVIKFVQREELFQRARNNDSPSGRWWFFDVLQKRLQIIGSRYPFLKSRQIVIAFVDVKMTISKSCSALSYVWYVVKRYVQNDVKFLAQFSMPGHDFFVIFANSGKK